MYCFHCGAKVEETDKFCPACGGVVEREIENQEENAAMNVKPEKKLSIKALVGFIVSLSGLLVLTIPCGIVGLVFSILGMKEIKSSDKTGKGFAMTGLIVSIIDIAIGVCSMIASTVLMGSFFSLLI